MSRSVPEWRGSTPDAKIPDTVKARVWLRCGGCCALTGRKLRPGDAHEYDHILPLALGGLHAESNLQLVSSEAHKVKTRDDIGAIRKADRIGRKHRGEHPKSKGNNIIRSRGFQKRGTP